MTGYSSVVNWPDRPREENWFLWNDGQLGTQSVQRNTNYTDTIQQNFTVWYRHGTEQTHSQRWFTTTSTPTYTNLQHISLPVHPHIPTYNTYHYWYAHIYQQASHTTTGTPTYNTTPHLQHTSLLLCSCTASPGLTHSEPFCIALC